MKHPPLVVGSIAFDLLLATEQSFTVSPACIAQHAQKLWGGTAGNIAWNLSLLSTPSAILSTLGEDGSVYRERLMGQNIDVEHVDEQPALTAMAVIATDCDGAQRTFFHPGADAFGTLPTVFPPSCMAIVSPRNPLLMLEACRRFQKEKIPFFFDPGQCLPAFGKTDLLVALHSAQGMFVNEEEWTLFQSITQMSAHDVLEKISILIVTQAERGCCVMTRDGVQQIAAFSLQKFVNPTGAGDALRAGVLSAYYNGDTVLNGVIRGSALASLVCEQDGGQIENLDTIELKRREEWVMSPLANSQCTSSVPL